MKKLSIIPLFFIGFAAAAQVKLASDQPAPTTVQSRTTVNTTNTRQQGQSLPSSTSAEEAISKANQQQATQKKGLKVTPVPVQQRSATGNGKLASDAPAQSKH